MSGGSNRGSILVIVLFFAGVIGVFAAVATVSLQAGTDTSRSFAESMRAEEAMRGAIEQAMALSGPSGLPRSASTVVAVGDAMVALTFRDEIARINLNQAPAELLSGLFRAIGVDATLAQQYATRILAWRSPDPRGTERALYRASGLIDGPRNGPFIHVSELGLVLGIPPAVAAAAAPYLTVASGSDKINPLFADAAVLLALPGMSEDRVHSFLQDRQFKNLPAKDLITRMGPVEKYVTEEQSAAVRVEARVRFGGRNDRPFEVVVSAVPGDTEPYRILAWDANPPARARQLP